MGINQDTRVSPTSRLVVVAPGDARIAPVVGVQQREDGPVRAHDDREGRLVPDGIQVEKLSFQPSCGSTGPGELPGSGEVSPQVSIPNGPSASQRQGRVRGTPASCVD